MMYTVYDAMDDVVGASRLMAATAAAGTTLLPSPLRNSLGARMVRANGHLAVHTRLTHKRPNYRVDAVEVGGKIIPVEPTVVSASPFGSLLRFAKETEVEQPRVLIVPAMSGHFGTLLRDTVATMSADHDVYILDWHNPRDVPLSNGVFGVAEYVRQTREALEFLGDPVHVVAVCQPCPLALAAVSMMAEDDSPAQPRTLTLMAGPIDIEVNPTSVNELAQQRPIEWFENNMIARVPRRYPGAGRQVYPGFVQVSAFVSMNLQRHLKAHVKLWGNVVDNNHDEVARTREFYDEYFAVCDLDAHFYLETVDQIFQRNLLAKGQFVIDGRSIDPGAIRRTALLTVEGEKDDICSVGQTMAAHDLCRGLPANRKAHHLQAGVGHYGVFSGSRWRNEIYPRVRNYILTHN